MAAPLISRSPLFQLVFASSLVMALDLGLDVLVTREEWLGALHLAIGVVAVSAVFLIFRRELRERYKTEAALRGTASELEARINERTSALVKANQDLQAEIAERARLENEREKVLLDMEDERNLVSQYARTLREERSILEAIMENTDTMLVYLDNQFRFVRVNSSYAKGCGHPLSELIGKDHFSLFPSEENRAIFEQVRDTGEAVTFHAKPFVYADQPWRGVTYWDWTLVPVMSGGGEVQGLAFSLRDVTHQKRGEQELQEREQAYRQLMEEASDAILLADAEGRVIAANRRACEILGYHAEDLLDSHIERLIPPEDLKTLTARYEEINAGKTAVVEHRLRRKDGTLVPVETSGRRITENRYQAIVRDISDRKRLEEEFSRAVMSQVFHRLYATLREFRHGEGLAMNLHRISLFARNLELLTTKGGAESAQRRFESAITEFVTIGYTQLREVASMLRTVESELSTNISPGEEQLSGRDILVSTEGLKNDLRQLPTLLPLPFESSGAREVGDRIAQRIDVLLRKLTSLIHQLNAHYTATVVEVAQAVVDSLRASSPGAHLMVEERTPRLTAIISPAELGEVLSMLIANALEALSFRESVGGSIPGEVVVRIRGDDRRVAIEVEDNGPGVPPELREHIFAPGITTKGVGRGQGLSMVRDHLSIYGGTISYDESYSGGARFLVELVKA